MNIKLNNDDRHSSNFSAMAVASSVKEERRRTGRYIAILVGICLLLLAIYHAWVRRIPVVASLVVPALIMFIYVGWVLFTASRDKHKALHAQAVLNAISQQQQQHEERIETPDSIHNNIEIAVISNNETLKLDSPIAPNWGLSGLTSIVTKGETNNQTTVQGDVRSTKKPIILVNDEPPEDDIQNAIDMTSVVVESVPDTFKIGNIINKKRFRRKYCRSKRQNVFKRSYSIA